MSDVLEWHLSLRNFVSKISLSLSLCCCTQGSFTLLHITLSIWIFVGFGYVVYSVLDLGHSRCVLVYLLCVNWIMRLMDWKACSSWAKKGDFLAFFCSTWGHACSWIICVFDAMDGDAHDLLCISVSLCCPGCCVLLWPWFVTGCLKLLVVFEKTFRDDLWFNCRLNFHHTSLWQWDWAQWCRQFFLCYVPWIY